MHIFSEKVTVYVDSELVASIEKYSPMQHAVDVVKATQVLLLVGISGAGKDTTKKELMKRGGFYHIVSHTTRPMRKDHGELEQDGLQYYFVNREKIKQMVQDHTFFEVKNYSGNMYGTTYAEFENAAKNHAVAIADVDVHGVAEYMQYAPLSTKPVFLIPPSYEVWMNRFVSRYEGKISSVLPPRLRAALQEIKHVLEVDYFYIVVNADLDESVREVISIMETGQQSSASREYGIKIAEQLLADISQELHNPDPQL